MPVSCRTPAGELCRFPGPTKQAGGGTGGQRLLSWSRTPERSGGPFLLSPRRDALSPAPAHLPVRLTQSVVRVTSMPPLVSAGVTLRHSQELPLAIKL